jgi:glucose/arabinose dehydrogenase/fibronectin type 3 domain-containing protein
LSRLSASTARKLVVTFALIAGVFSCENAALADTFTDSGFATETIATLPSYTLAGSAFAPDGRLFVWQKNGIVRIIKNGQLLPTPFINLSSKVNTFDDRGFWGLAFDPQFSANGRVYMTYTYESGGDPNSPNARTSRLTRVNVDPANPDVALPASEVTILGSIGTPPCSDFPKSADCIGSDGGSHTLGALHFASDGTLYVGVGDGSNGDANSLRAQDLDVPEGKILRIRTDGSALSDNPFYDGTNSWRSRVFLYGVRNPFGYALLPETDEVYFGDVGWNTWEEFNHGSRGSNFGWPCYEGALPQPTFQSDYAQCRALSASAVTMPYFTYDRSLGAAAIGGPFYSGTLYPSNYWGNWFFADYVGGWIRRVTFDAQHQPVSNQVFATDVDSPTSIAMGPDGMLYYTSFVTGQVRRVRYNGPVAQAAVTPSYGYSPLSVTFSSAGSVDPGGGSISYLWDFGDGTTSTAANPTHTYTSSSVRTFAAQLTVTNSAGLKSTSPVTVTVGSAPPTPTITAPADGTSVIPGQVINYQGSATDPEDGALPASALSWTVLLHHNTHVHSFVGGTGTSGSFQAEDHGDIGTFSYEIILTATDSSGLKKSTSVNIPVVADTSNPTAPASLTATPQGTSRIDLDWPASSDNVNVTGYHVERCVGAGCTNFAEIAAPTATHYTDTTAAASTTYRYRVRAEDPSHNLSGYSPVATATTGDAPPPPPGLVGAWSFNEGIGTTAADASGNGNTGTVNAATWTTQGRFDGALSFDGLSSTVRVPNAASLNFTSAMTVSAWIRPAATQNDWKTVLQRQNDAWFLNASTSAGPLRPGFGGTFGSSTDYVAGPTASPVGAWTHLAATYDGSTIRLFVNGTQVASRAESGAIQSVTNPLWIGGNQPYGEYFNGLIDEVRVYNRALPQSEIASDMNTPVVPGAPDTTAPSTPTGLTATAVSASQINLSWSASTDNIGVSNYRLERCAGDNCTDFVEVATPATNTYNDTGRAPATSYRYRVRAADSAGNLSGYSTIVNAATPAGTDTTAPSAPTGVTATPVSTSRIDLTWTASTDNVGVSQYRVERCQGSSCTSWAQVGTTSALSFSSTGLAANTVYRFRVRAVDAAGNLSAYSTIVSARTLTADTTKPSAPTGLAATAVSPTRINLSWTASTDNVGVTGYRIERCAGSACTNYAEITTTTTTSYADTTVVASTVYRYRVRATDAAGNLSNYSSVVSATTPAVPDSTPPTDPTGLTASNVGSGQINLSWTASTDNVRVAAYRVERCQGATCTTFAEVAAPTTTTYSDFSLSASTTYRYRVRAVDPSNNFSGYSAIAQATTDASSGTPAGLVGAWAFNEGMGTTAADSSGNGNTGTITAGTWTTLGRYGNALSFNGSSSIVQVPNAASLNFTAGITMSAWIRPAATQNDWKTVMQRQTDAWFLNASTSAGPLRPGGGGTFGGSTDYVAGPTASPVGAWTHLAFTYDGSMMRLYVNGTQVASRAEGGAIQSVTNPLWIGGNQPYGEYFNGLIDEARVYNRALAQPEIANDMSTSIILGAPPGF